MSAGRFLDIVSSRATPVSVRRFSAPFSGDKEMYVHEQDFVIAAKKFRPLELGSPDSPDHPSSYLVEESPLTDAGGGLVKWTRTYSRIPGRRFDGESYAWTMPGIAVEAVYNQTGIDNAQTYNIPGGLTRIVTTGSHGLVPGHLVEIHLWEKVGDVQKQFTLGRSVVAKLSDNTFTVAAIAADSPYYLSVQRTDYGRNPVTRQVHSILQYDYFAPGLPGQPKTFQEIPILQPTYIRDASGKETDTYALDTIPTKASYLADVAAKSIIIVEPSTVRYWRGRIAERVTRFVAAQ